MSLTAGEIMTREVVSALPSDTVSTVARKLAERGIGGMPVCEADGTLLGVITDADLLKPFSTSAIARRRWWLDALAEGTDLAAEFKEYSRADHRTAAELMSRDVVTATEDTPASDLAEMLSEPFNKRVFILRGKQLVGVVTRQDLVRALAEGAEGLED